MREAGVPISPGLEESTGSKISRAEYTKARSDTKKEIKPRKPLRKQLVDAFCKGCGQYGHDVN